MTYWEGPSRWINTVLLVIVSFIGLDTLFRLLEAREENFIVGGVRAVANVFLWPFADMFDEQHYLLTALIAVIGYGVLAAVTLAIVRSVQASPRRREPERPVRPAQTDVYGDRRPLDGPAAGRPTDETRRL